MKFQALANILLTEVLLQHVFSASVRSIFLFKDVMKSNTAALKTSGFNTFILFGVGVLDNGDIKYYSNTPGSKDVLIASNGAYVGGDALANKVRSFKTGNDTGVNRLEISMNAQHVRKLMANPGPGAETPVYRNFKALKTAWLSSPVSAIGTWTSPVLIIQGDDDRNVHVSQSIDLVNRLEKKGVPFETMMIVDDTHHWMNFANSVTVYAAAADFFVRQFMKGGGK